MADNSAMMKTNPVFLTGIGATRNLGQSGDEIARAYAAAIDPSGKLNMAPLETGNETMEIFGEKIKALNIIFSLEYRHKMMNAFIYKSGYRNVLDLPCGYTPRAVRMGENGINYVGGDLPVVIQTMTRISAPYRKDFKTVNEYREVDVTNPASMNDAADLLNGKIIITTDGLLGYLQIDEMRLMASNIRDILQKHGGCWVTTDMGFGAIATVIANTLDESPEKITTLLTRAGSIVSDTRNMKDLAKDPVAMKALLADCGLKVDTVSSLTDDAPFFCEKYLSEEKKAQFREGVKQTDLWVITLDETKTLSVKNADSQAAGSSVKLEGKVLSVSLHGRIDSISAPDVLQTYEAVAKDAKFDEVKVDAKDLAYISSAGLRVLLMMIKASKEQKMSMENANETVMDILQTTVFADMMQFVK